jgi:hypothetical protein
VGGNEEQKMKVVSLLGDYEVNDLIIMVIDERS